MNKFKDFLEQIRTEHLVDVSYFKDLIIKVETLDNCFEKFEIACTADDNFFDLLMMAKTSEFIDGVQFKSFYSDVYTTLYNIQLELLACLHKHNLTEQERKTLLNFCKAKIKQLSKSEFSEREPVINTIGFYKDCIVNYENKYFEICYIDYLNNYLTVEGYADLNYLDLDHAQEIIKKGKEIYRESLPKNIELIKLGRKVVYAIFDGLSSKRTVLLKDCKICYTIEEVQKTIPSYKLGA